MLAAHRVKEPGLLDVLRHWLEDKFQLPWSHEAFQDYTLLELLTLFWEDYYRKHPIDAKRVGSGKEVKFVTGDPLLDKWEDELARGLTPDLTEGLSPEDRAKERAAAARIDSRGETLIKADIEIGEGFVEKYGA